MYIYIYICTRTCLIHTEMYLNIHRYSTYIYIWRLHMPVNQHTLSTKPVSICRCKSDKHEVLMDLIPPARSENMSCQELYAHLNDISTETDSHRAHPRHSCVGLVTRYILDWENISRNGGTFAEYATLSCTNKRNHWAQQYSA